MSLKNKIILSIALLIFTFGGLATYSVFYYAKNVLVNNEKNGLAGEVEELSNELGQILYHAEIVTKTITEQESIKKYLAQDDKNFQDENILKLLEYYNIKEIYSAIYMLSQDGIALVSTDQNFTGNDYSFRYYFQEAISGTPAIDSVVGVTSKELGYYFSYPVKDDAGKILGVVVTKMKPDFLNQHIILKSAKGNAYTMLVNKEGVIIYSSEKEKIYKSLGNLEEKEKQKIREGRRFEGINIQPMEYDVLQNNLKNIEQTELFDYKNKNNEEEILSVSRIKNYPFFLVIKKSAGEYLQPAIKISYLLGFFVLLATFLCSLVIFFIITNFLKPLKKIHEATIKFGEGDLSSRIEIKKRGELKELSEAFNKMADNIKKSRAEVDKKVKEQTKEIASNAEFLSKQQEAILNVLEDVEIEKDKAKEEKEKIDIILHSIGDGVFVVDNNLNVILCNEVTSKISGFNCKELMNSRYDKNLKFIYEERKKEINKFISEAIDSGKIKEGSRDTALIRKDGTKISIANSAAPLKNKLGKVIGCVIVFRDVTKERQIDKAKTEFVSLASHQLRTPLAVINWYTEMLLSKDVGKINENQKQYLKEIYGGSQRMVDLVNSLLNVSRIELGTLAIDPRLIKIQNLSKSVIHELEPEITKKKLKIEEKYEKGLPMIKVDPKLMRVIMQNLLSNSVKYTPEKGKINILIKKEEGKSKNIRISVSDTGYGIPSNQKEKIFSKLFRADNVVKKETNGTGLGLYTTKSVVEQFGGKIWFESKENIGTTFYVSIPIKGVRKKTGSKGLEQIK